MKVDIDKVGVPFFFALPLSARRIPQLPLSGGGHKTNNLPSLPRGASFGPEEEEEEEGSVISPTGERWRKGPLRSCPVATDRRGIILLRQGSRSSLLVQGSRNIGEFPSVESIRQEVPDPRPAIPHLARQSSPFLVATK